MNTLSVVSLVATVVLFGAAIFLGVQNRADSVKMRERVEALEAQFEGGAPTAGAQGGEAAGQAPSLESQLLAQRNQEVAELKEELQRSAQEQGLLDQQFQKIQEEKNRPMTDVQRKIAAAPAIAEVVEFVPDLGFVALNAGANRQIEPGMDFAIRRGSYLIGRVVIGETVADDSSIADVVPGSIPEGFAIQAGDEVVELMR
ncbi:hypothetical protein BH23VER1_BH23VER1_14980 [soil metagenome]